MTVPSVPDTELTVPPSLSSQLVVEGRKMVQYCISALTCHLFLNQLNFEITFKNWYHFSHLIVEGSEQSLDPSLTALTLQMPLISGISLGACLGSPFSVPRWHFWYVPWRGICSRPLLTIKVLSPVLLPLIL